MYSQHFSSGAYSYQYAGSHTHTNTAYMTPPQNMAEEVIQPTGMGFVGLPIRFDSGQFHGKTIRTELHEIQQANLGRKYARVDRRPLDPPPVVEMRLYEVQDGPDRRKQETEMPNYEEIQVLGFLCTVDLFPVVGAGSPRTAPSSRSSGHRKSNSASSSVSTNSSIQSRSTLPNTSPRTHGPYNYAPSHHSLYSSTASTLLPSVPSASISSHLSGATYTPQVPPTPSDIVHYTDNNIAITESSRMTDALVGATFVQPQMIDYKGRKTLVFVFSDLAVKIEGEFILRYRVFDLYSTIPGHSDRVIQAECYGGAFKVYSTKEFPGLKASTSLTKLISRYGVRLNIRETERKRRKKGEVLEDTDAGASGKGKRKHLTRDLEEAEEGGTEED